jgi:hypothetical protein
MLHGILQECGCETCIPVKKYAYYEGPIFMKYGVGIMLPAKLGMTVVMQAGEARAVCAAYKIAVLKASTSIREHKTKQLLGTRFKQIPHDDEDEDPRQDSYRLAKKHPHASSKHMDRCKDM